MDTFTISFILIQNFKQFSIFITMKINNETNFMRYLTSAFLVHINKGKS